MSFFVSSNDFCFVAYLLILSDSSIATPTFLMIAVCMIHLFNLFFHMRLIFYRQQDTVR